MAVIFPHALIRGLTLAHRADMTQAPDEKERLMAEARAAFQSVAACEHKTPRAAYEVGRLAYGQVQEVLRHFTPDTPGQCTQIAKMRRNLNTAIDYYNIAAGMPDYQRDLAPAKALEELAQLHENGFMVKGKLVGLYSTEVVDSRQFDCETAFELRKKAAAQGLFDSQMRLAMAYFIGRGVKTSYKDAFRWCCKAGDNTAMQSETTISELAVLREMILQEMNDELDGVKAPMKSGLKLIQSPEITKDKRLREGHVWLKVANHEKSKASENRTDFDHACAMAISLYEPYAGLEQREPSAAYHLGLTYYVMAVEADCDPALTPDERYMKSDKYLVKAAQNFHVVLEMPPKEDSLVCFAAADALSRVYENDDVSADAGLWQRILTLRTMSAQGGWSEAQYSLAKNYFEGEYTTEPNLKKARQWIDRALHNERNPLQSDVIDAAKNLEAKIARAEKWAKRGWTPDQPKVIRLPVAAKQAVP